MEYFILSHPLTRPLYSFLNECNNTSLEKEILDCGAGGRRPPLTIFYQQGYKTHGIDISDHALNLAEKFCQEQKIQLNITKGDMREIPFDDESLSFVYSLNTIVHLSKSDTIIAIKEFERILKPNGLCYVNFDSVDSPACGQGQEVNQGEWMIVLDDGTEVTHSFYADDEPDKLFNNFKILRKEKRSISLPIDIGGWRDGGWQNADISYILKKK